MKRTLLIVVVMLIVVVAVPTWAGEKKHKECTADPQDCLAKMHAKIAQKPWLGVELKDTKDGRYKITGVVAESPAEAAGFQKGDVLLAMNGHDYAADDKKAVEKAWSGMSPGSEATYLVLRKGGKLELEAELGHVPEQMMAEWIGKHMIYSHLEAPVKVAAKQ